METQKFIDSRVSKDHLLDQYEIDKNKILGSGSFGTVYEACHKKDKSIKIAIKAVNKSGQSLQDIMLLRRELRILSKLDNPNIAKYFENYEDEFFIYICMELCQGGDLEQYIAKNLERPMTEREIANFMVPLLGALNHCHSQKIIHRDIKPANIMFDKSKEIKFIDFGVAVAKKDKNAKLGLAGSPLYMSPEVVKGKNYDWEADIWSLGVTLFFLASFSYPFGVDESQGEGLQDLF